MEKETDIIYELEQEETPEFMPPQESMEQEEAADHANSSPSDQSDLSDNNSDVPEETEEPDPAPCSEAESEIAAMVKEMGAERVLEIIRGNRNSAIEQILAELESSADRTLQSGVSVGNPCNSIFDLAALA